MTAQPQIDQRQFAFDSSYRERAQLAEGPPVELRLLQADDREELLASFERLSSESRYYRFLGPRTEISEAELDYLCDIDQFDHVAVCAEVTAGEQRGRGAGVARFIRSLDDDSKAEAAIAVADDFQNRGLGGLLFRRLANAALERHIETFRATLFRDNRAMEALLDKIGSRVDVVDVQGNVVTVEAPLAETALRPS